MIGVLWGLLSWRDNCDISSKNPRAELKVFAGNMLCLADISAWEGGLEAVGAGRRWDVPQSEDTLEFEEASDAEVVDAAEGKSRIAVREVAENMKSEVNPLAA